MTVDEEVEEILEQLYDFRNNSLEKQGEIRDYARQQIIQRRVMLSNMLDRAIAHLDEVSCTTNLKISMAGTVKGLSAKFMITIGRFVRSKNGGWLFEPTDSDIAMLATRLPTKRAAVREGVRLQHELVDGVVFEGEGDEKKIVSEQWKIELREHLENLKSEAKV